MKRHRIFLSNMNESILNLQKIWLSILSYDDYYFFKHIQNY